MLEMERVPEVIHKLQSLRSSQAKQIKEEPRCSVRVEVCQHLTSWLYGRMYAAAVFATMSKRRKKDAANYDNCEKEQGKLN